MANASLDWHATDRFSMFLTGEARSKRYRGVSSTGEHLHYKDYTVLHLGASFEATQWLTVNARINNLLDRDFTTYDANFIDNGDGTWTLSPQDHYNNKDKARNFWVSLNFRF